MFLPAVREGDWSGVRKNFQKLSSIKLGDRATPTFAELTLTGLTASQLLQTDTNKKLTSIALPLIVSKGGTGAATLTDHSILLGSGTGAVTALGAATNGQLPIGSTGADPVLATITGTSNQITVTNAAGTITLSAPQDLHTGASPTFAGATLSGLTAGRIPFAGAGGLISDDPNLFWDNTNKRVGIGTATPNSPLSVISAADTSAIQIRRTGEANNQARLGFRVANTDSASEMGRISVLRTNVTNAGNADMIFSTHGVTAITEKMRILSGGNVGIGTTTPSARLNVEGGGITMGDESTEGETEELKLYGYRTSDALRSLEIGVGVDAADTASFDGLSNYSFDGNITLPKASGNGIKVDRAAATFGWADLQGNITNSKGATKPTEVTYRGGITQFQFSAGDDAGLEFHIPHDYVAGTDIHLHVHWSHIGTLVTGGTLTFTVESSYAKGHNQAAFSAPVTGTFTGTASTTQYQHIVSETQYSASSPSGLQIDTDDLEPDGMIIMRFEMTTNSITVSGGGVPDPFIHHIDIHYQTTGVIGTKQKAPDFYT